MEGELVFYDRATLNAWRPRSRTNWRDVADTSSTLGQLYADWNATNRRAMEAYDASIVNRDRYEKARGIWNPSSEADPEARTSPPASTTASITIETVSIVSGVEVLTVTVIPA
jgi:hypothetical protein